MRAMTTPGETTVVRTHLAGVPWPVYWSSVWVGVLAALATALLFGLAGMALGAHQVGPARQGLSWNDLGVGALILGVLGAFLSFVVGGWVAARIADLRRAEPAMLHGAIVWLVAIPLLLLLAALGAGSVFGSWYGGLAGTPPWASSAAGVDPATAEATPNGALGALTALLLGLVGGVIGGWMGSGEPMSLTHHRTRELARRPV
jgi:hypothetical protein